jgi:hypothetical protein
MFPNQYTYKLVICFDNSKNKNEHFASFI